MPIPFSDVRGVVYIEFVPTNQIVNIKNYLQHSKEMRTSLFRKSPNLWNPGYRFSTTINVPHTRSSLFTEFWPMRRRFPLPFRRIYQSLLHFLVLQVKNKPWITATKETYLSFCTVMNEQFNENKPVELVENWSFWKLAYFSHFCWSATACPKTSETNFKNALPSWIQTTFWWICLTDSFNQKNEQCSREVGILL